MYWFTPLAVAHDQPPHPMRDLLHRIEAVWPPLVAAIAAALHPIAHILPLAGRIALAIRRLQRARTRILSILTRCAEGTWQDPRPRTPAPRTRRRPPAPYLPRRRNWLGGATGSEVRSLASQLAHLLNDPGTRHILASAPIQARAAVARTLRGPARMFDLELPSCLQLSGPPRHPASARPGIPPPVPRGRSRGAASSPPTVPSPTTFSPSPATTAAASARAASPLHPPATYLFH